MKSRVFILSILLAAMLHAEEQIRVIPMPANSRATFEFGGVCSFERTSAPLPDEPLRVRIIRGTRDSLKRWGSDRMNVRNACVEYYSVVVRPRTRSTEQLDLDLFVGTGWLDGENDGHFVFVVEADDQPGADRIEYRKFRLRPERVTQYFDAGQEVTVRAPPQRIAATPSRASRSMYAGVGIECAIVQWDQRRIFIREANAQPDITGESVAGSH